MAKKCFILSFGKLALFMAKKANNFLAKSISVFEGGDENLKKKP